MPARPSPPRQWMTMSKPSRTRARRPSPAAFQASRRRVGDRHVLNGQVQPVHVPGSDGVSEAFNLEELEFVVLDERDDRCGAPVVMA